ncbi:MAG: DUF948 domain-containing protein [Ignavibacteriales bacterium]|nr:DUF948 domain-containing protein [Ignavibacteriales bacterium]
MDKVTVSFTPEIYIALIIILAIFILVAVYIVILIVRVNKTLEQFQGELRLLTDHTIKALKNIEETTKETTQLLNDVERQINRFESFVDNVINKIPFLKSRKREEETDDFEPEKSRGHINNLLNNLHAIKTGLSIFWTKLRE